jgi:hypothetical protein
MYSKEFARVPAGTSYLLLRAPSTALTTRSLLSKRTRPIIPSASMPRPRRATRWWLTLIATCFTSRLRDCDSSPCTVRGDARIWQSSNSWMRLWAAASLNFITLAACSATSPLSTTSWKASFVSYRCRRRGMANTDQVHRRLCGYAISGINSRLNCVNWFALSSPAWAKRRTFA